MSISEGIKVSNRIKPLRWRERPKLDFKEGDTYYVSFGGHRSLPCTLIRYMEEYRNERILIEVRQKGILSTHVLFPDEIGRTPEEAVMREVSK